MSKWESQRFFFFFFTETSREFARSGGAKQQRVLAEIFRRLGEDVGYEQDTIQKKKKKRKKRKWQAYSLEIRFRREEKRKKWERERHFYFEQSVPVFINKNHDNQRAITRPSTKKVMQKKKKNKGGTSF